MSEWWTYRPSDFLMFSARTHARLFELYNRDVWPLHLLMFAVVAALLWAITRRPDWLGRAPAAVLALIWFWVGWGFHWTRHAQIHTGAPYLAAAFWVQAVGLLALAAAKPVQGEGRRLPFAGAALVGAGLLWPLLAPLTGREWTQAEAFGIGPEPTALVTVGWLLADGRVRYRGWAAVIPALSLVVGLGTTWLLYGPR